MENVLTIGGIVFDDSSIEMNSLKGTFSVDVIGNELTIDEFTATVRFDGFEPTAYRPVGADGYRLITGDLYAVGQNAAPLTVGSSAVWAIDGTTYRSGYLSSVERVGKKAWKLVASSLIGKLANRYHAGGLYYNVKLGVILNDIVGTDFGWAFNDTAFSDLPVSGWLPYDTARANLHRLLFAVGASLLRSDTWDYDIGFLPTAVKTVPDSRVALGGKVAYTNPSVSVEVTEYGYYVSNNDPDVVLFEGTADNTLVTFAAPMHDLMVTDSLTIIGDPGVNYAVVSGTGTLTGKQYSVTKRIVTAGSGTDVKKVTGNGLISALNAQNVAKRLFRFYSSAKKVTTDILLEDENAGDLLEVSDAFGDRSKMFLQNMTVSVTSVKSANCTLIQDYQPGDEGNTFSAYQVLTSDGKFTVPAGVSLIYVVVVGGGDGGSGGYDGADGLGRRSQNDNDLVRVGSLSGGDVGYVYSGGSQEAAAGGEAGEPGLSGKVLTRYLAVTPGQEISGTVGSGGAGGTVNGGEGEQGGASTFGDLSSVNGTRTTMVIPLANVTVCGAGEQGHAGGAGGLTDTDSTYADFGKDGLPGEAVGTYSAGSGGAGSITSIRNGYAYASGGGGGGAAHGANGSNGTAGTRTGEREAHVIGGSGGDGADAVTPTVQGYGWGGGGGNGGGGGGNAGGCRISDSRNGSDTLQAGAPGSGGAGSPGGAGGDGVIIILW